MSELDSEEKQFLLQVLASLNANPLQQNGEAIGMMVKRIAPKLQTQQMPIEPAPVEAT